MSVSKRECLERIRDLDTERRRLLAEIERLRKENANLRRQLDDVATLAGARLMCREAGGGE